MYFTLPLFKFFDDSWVPITFLLPRCFMANPLQPV